MVLCTQCSIVWAAVMGNSLPYTPVYKTHPQYWRKILGKALIACIGRIAKIGKKILRKG